MKNNQKHIYLVDGSTYIFRAYHALPPLTRKSDGFPVGAISGFCNMLDKLIRDEKQKNNLTHLLVVFDASGKTFRNEIYPEYKANRSSPPEDLIPQFPVIREATNAFNVPHVELLGYEADDLIASYTKSALSKDMQVTIVSSDKDLMQLVGDGASMLDTMKNRIIKDNEVIEKFGVKPNRVIDVQSLAGDSIDNVPGVPGIGIKTAALLINEYGDLDKLIENASQIKQTKRRESIIEFAEQARISRELVTLKDDIELPIPIDDIEIQSIEPHKLISFLKAMEFKTLTEKKAKEFNIYPDEVVSQKLELNFNPKEDTGEVQKNEEDIKKFEYEKYSTIQSLEELNKWKEKISEKGYVAIDTETDSLNAVEANLIGFSMAISNNEACYVPLNHLEESSQIELDQALKINENISEIHSSLGGYYYSYEYDFDKAEKSLLKALSLNPSSPEANRWYAQVRSLRFKPESLNEIKKAIKLEPKSAITKFVQVRILTTFSKLDEAMEAAEKVKEFDPQYIMGPYGSIETLYLQGKQEEALSLSEEAIKKFNDPMYFGIKGFLLGKLNRKEEALSVIDKLNKISSETNVRNQYIYMIHYSIGDHEKALSALNESIEKKQFNPFLFDPRRYWTQLLDNDKFKKTFHDLGLPLKPL